MIKAILMDFNGVIIDDEAIQMRAYQEILAKEDIALTDGDYYSSLGMDDKSFVAAAYERVGRQPETNKVLEITQAKTQRWRREMVADNVPLFEGIENFVRKMSAEFAVGIVSMAKREEIVFILDKTGLANCFSIIVSAEDVENSKPDPQCYRKGFRLIDLDRIAKGHLPMTHEECLVIEDSPPGAAAGKAAGLPVLGVMNTVQATEMRAAGADWVTKNLDDWMPESVRGVFV
jgi:HAD superfamily hydrolase (TIGR01509 family)